MEDHISKALARAQEQKPSVRNWVKPDSKVQDEEPPVREPTAEIAVEIDAEHLATRGILTNSDLDDPLVADRYRLLRTRLQQRMKPRDWNKVGVTSPASKEGKSFNCINLAVTFARESAGQVVLIDADIRRPSVGKYLGISAEQGLLDFLQGNAELADIVLRPNELGNLLVVPGTVADPTAITNESLGSRRMAELLEYFDAEGTTIIVDLPPVLVADDVLSITPLLDALIIVIRDGQTNLDELRQTTELLSEVNLLGTVLNGVEESGQGLYGYYYNSSSG